MNSVFVYDDKLVLTYNYKDGTETLTLQEIESVLVRIKLVCVHQAAACFLQWLFFFILQEFRKIRHLCLDELSF